MSKKEFNVIDHILVPKHVIMSNEEVKDLLAKYNISLKQLPAISIKDPAIKQMDIEAGNVIKILRNSAVGKSVYYRVVKNI